MKNQFIANDNKKPDTIMRIALSYHRVTRAKSKNPFSETIEYVLRDYSETLIIDRNTETLEFVQKIGAMCAVSRKYCVQRDISTLLDELGDSYFIDELNEKKLLTNIIANQEYSLYDPISGKDYTITIDYKSGTQKILSGTFDKNGLPNDYECFIDDVQNFMDCYNANEIFDSSIYSKLPRKINELIFCSVIFEDGGKTYYYITEDDSLEVGDIVIVPAGKGNHEAAVQIVGIDHFTRDEAPLPLEKVKRIIRKRDKI